jgi:hypothetical protein
MSHSKEGRGTLPQGFPSRLQIFGWLRTGCSYGAAHPEILRLAGSDYAGELEQAIETTADLVG